MSAVRILPASATEDQWHAAREGVMTGSRIAAVVGLSPYESRFSLWHRMSGLIEPQPLNEVMDWGKRLEPVVAAKFAEQHPEWRVRRTGTWAHPTRRWQVANPDRLLFASGRDPYVTVATDLPAPKPGQRGAWEGKTDRDDEGWGEEGTDEIPVYYRCQLLWYLDVLSLDFAYLSVLIGGSEYREYRVEYAADEAAFLREQAEEFLASLAAGDRPAIDEHAATYQAVRELHPDIDGQDVPVPDDIAVDYLISAGAAEVATARERKAKAALLDAMGSARRALHRGTPIARRQPHGSGSVALYQIKPKAPTGQKVSTSG